MSSVIDRLAITKIVPVLVLDDPGTATDVGAALAEGGVPIVEVTFRRRGAERAIADLAANPKLLVGAGTVLTVAQVDAAVDAGAAFLVSPGLDEQVVDRARQRGVVMLPGIATPTEIQRALRLDLSTVKLFPAGALGGLATLNALAAPFPGIRFIPTGGIDATDLGAYLRHPAVVAVGGSWLVRPSWIAEGRFDLITAAAFEARATADGVLST